MMGKIAKLFLICTLLLVGVSFADLARPLYFSCGKRTDDGVYACNIRQLESTKSTLQPQYTKWGEFLQVFQNRIEMDLGDPSAKTEYNGFEIIFESDIDLGGYQNGTCRDATFAPMYFGALAFQPTIDGNGKTIKNFCYIAEDENASFFSSLSNSTVKDITFLNAYVKAKTVSAGNRCGSLCDASVVTDTAEQVAFENVAVKGASVYGWQTSTLAITAKATSTDLNTPAVSLSHVTIQDVTLSMTRDVIAEYSDAEYRYDLQSASGGVVANLRGHFKMDDSLKVLNLSAPDSISKVFKDVTNKEYVGNRYVGGIAGYFSPSADDADFDLDSIEVSAALSGLWVGGLFGRVYIDTSATKDDDIMIKGSSSFKVKDSKVTLNSPVYLGGNIGKGKDMNRYFGGLVGELIWWKGPVLLLNNTVDVSADWHGDKEYTNAAYMGGLVGLVTGGKELSVVDVSAENDTVTAEMQTSSKSVYAGGILGRVGLADDYGISGNVRISASRVKAKESNLITTTASEIITVNASYLVGNAVSRGGVFEIQRNHSEGNVNINNDMLSASGAVGAEIGLGWSSGAYIYNNTSVGNLLVKKVIGNTMSLRITKGYVAGRLTGEDPDSKIKLGNNIHYGTSDMGVFRAVDTLIIAGQAHNASTWNKTYSSSVDVRYNYRNALKGDSALAADGSLKKNGSGEIIVNKNTGDSWYNGVIDADVMKSRLFTYVMNATQPSGSTVTWDNKPSFLPVISEKRTAYRLAISLLDEDYIQLTPADTAALRDYLPAEQCEARTGICSLYVYTENDLMLKSDLKSTFDGLNAGFMLIDKLSTDVSGRFDYNQKFTKDKTVNGLTDREIEVEYVVEKLGGSDYVPLDEYADYLSYVSPRVDKIRLISGKGVIPVFWLDNDAANGNVPEYELDCDYAYNPCKAGVSLSVCDESSGNFNVRSTASRIGTFEEVLKAFRKRYDGMHQNKLVLKYMPTDLSQGKGTLPRIDVGLFGTNAKINMTAYAYNGKGALKENDSRELGDGIIVQADVNMTSKYQFSLADRGFVVNAWNVDFWVDLNGSSTDAIAQCYDEGSKTAKCVGTREYVNPTATYLDGVYNIASVLNGQATSNVKYLMKWSTELGVNDTLSLDSMIYAMADAIPTRAPKAVVLMGVVPDLQVVSYTVNFDVNADGKNVFLTDKLMDELENPKSYSRQNAETAKLPEGVLATNACFSGWDNGQIGVMGAKHYTSLDGDLLERANPNDDGSFNLYGNWVPTSLENGGCKVEKSEVILKVVDKTGAEGDYGTVTLNQSYKKLGKDTETFTHKFNSGKLEIPVSADAMTLHVASVQTNKEYDLAKLTLKKADGTELPIPLGPQDTSFKIAPAAGVTDTLYAVFAGYIDVRLDSLRDGAYFSVSDSKAINDKKLHLVETGTTPFPKWVYTTTECVLGWSVKPDGANYDRGVIASDDLIAKLTSDKTLYAVWKNADVCVEKAGYRRLKLESEHGTVEIAEINTVNGSVKAMHAFAEDDFTMLLPQDYTHTKWVVRAVPQRGYKLDSVVIDGRIKLVEGDKLADTIQGYLPMKAYFSEDKAPVVSGPDTLERLKPILSGNAMHLTLEWKVESGRVAELHMELTDVVLGEVIEDTVISNVVGSGTRNWDEYPLLPGTYKAKVTLRDGTYLAVDSALFTVSSEIAAAPNTWQMVSLSDVDESAIVWDGDPAFYYWDETAKYGVAWKYQKYNRGSVMIPQQGIWYKSLEGRALPLRRDVATGSDVAHGAHQIVWNVEAGWNMVANPYGWRVVLPENVLNTFEMCKWSAESGFEPVHSLEPYEAVWLRSDTKTSIPPFMAEPAFNSPVNAAGLQKAALAKATRQNWTLQAELRDTRGHGDSWNVLGVGAAEERLEPPAGMGDFVNLSVVEGRKALLKSIKSAEDDRHEWKLALSATTDRVGYLKFEGVKALNDMGLKVYVTIDGKTTEMGAGDSLRVMLKSAASTATVQVTSSAVTTVASKLENLHFERVPGALQVGFDVPSDLAGAGYRVQLVSVNGKVAASYRGKSTAGHNTLALTAPKPGLYLLRVTLGRHHAVRKVAISR